MIVEKVIQCLYWWERNLEKTTKIVDDFRLCQNWIYIPLKYLTHQCIQQKRVSMTLPNLILHTFKLSISSNEFFKFFNIIFFNSTKMFVLMRYILWWYRYLICSYGWIFKIFSCSSLMYIENCCSDEFFNILIIEFLDHLNVDLVNRILLWNLEKNIK